MKVLLSCVNTAVSLVGFDLTAGQPFWYCPANILRSCGICATNSALWVASDSTLTRIHAEGVRQSVLPGPHENLAHSVKTLGQDLLGVVDTGNSRVLLMSGESAALSCSPLEGWTTPLPPDAIHLNDILPWQDGILASAFSHQPFGHLKHSYPGWNKEGLGVIFHMRRHGKHTVSRIVASGLNCPHSLTLHENRLYCCSSSTGDLYCLAPASNGTFFLEQALHITNSHFLRGCLRVEEGWLLGGSTRRHIKDAEDGGMVLFHLNDDGRITRHVVAGTGEIYDILPWNAGLMHTVAKQLETLPDLPLEGEFPPRCKAEMLPA